MSTSTRRSWVSIGLLAAISAGAVFAQPAQPTIRSVTFFTIKADRVGDYLSAVKDYVALRAKAGSERYMSNWQSLSGTREYALVTYHAKWAELDVTPDPTLQSVAAQNSALVARINATVESRRTVHYALEGELSLPMPGGDPQPLARVLRTWVRPEQLSAYRALVKSDLLPAAKKAGLTVYSVARVRFGGSTYEYNSVTGLDKWAELDGEAPLTAAMGGQAAYDKFLAKLRTMITRSEYEMYRFLKDQSYMPPAK